MPFSGSTFYEKIRQLLQIKLASNWTETRVQYDNVKLNPAPLNSEAWIAFNIGYGFEKNSEFGNGITRRQQGFAQITIYIPVNIGTTLCKQITSNIF